MTATSSTQSLLSMVTRSSANQCLNSGWRSTRRICALPFGVSLRCFVLAMLQSQIEQSRGGDDARNRIRRGIQWHETNSIFLLATPNADCHLRILLQSDDHLVNKSPISQSLCSESPHGWCPLSLEPASTDYHIHILLQTNAHLLNR